jgi:hypothetical protein
LPSMRARCLCGSGLSQRSFAPAGGASLRNRVGLRTSLKTPSQQTT